MPENSAVSSKNAAPQFLVQGVVSDRARRPAGSMTVTAFDQDLRTRQQLGRSRTNANGEFRIDYTSVQFKRAEQGGADLVLEVRSQADELLHTTATHFHAPPKLTIDITLASRGGEAEFDRILRELTPLLEGQDVELTTLEENSSYRDLTFAATETGIALARLRDFALAQRLSRLTKLQAEFWFAALRTQALEQSRDAADRVTGLADAAQGILSDVPRIPPADIETGLKRAISEGTIARQFERSIAGWLAEYRSLQQSEAARKDGPHNVQAVVNATGLSGKQADLFLAAYLAGGSRSEIVRRVRTIKGFSAKDVESIDTTLAVDELTLRDGRLLAVLRTSIDQPAKARDLAKMSQEDWLAAIDRAKAVPPAIVEGGTAADKRKNYAALLMTRAQLVYPTTAFAGDFARALRSKQKPAIGNANDVLAFFETHPTFELGTTSIDGYLKDNAQPSFFNARNKGALVRQLKALQRVYKFAPSFGATNTLLAEGIHSAQQAYRLGESQFISRFGGREGFTEESARRAYQRAANTHVAVVTVVGELRATDNANAVATLANDVPALKEFPNLANLFGKADFCECEYCRSIFSSSAYLADLLMYLKGRTLTAGGTANAVLLSRRPDIAYLDFSCENSNTPLPMIDLACEVLEDHVAPWKLFDIPLALAAQLTAGPVAAAVASAFAAQAAPAKPIALSGAALVSAKDSLNAWVLRDGDASYRITAGAAALEVSLMRQTRGTEEELNANPEYVNEGAYQTLKKATYPLGLPFDLFTEEARECLKRMNLRRSDLVEVFRGPNSPNNPTDLDIAGEYLGIGRYEQNLILQADLSNQGPYWGETTTAAAIASLSPVDVFLGRTRLEYADLQRLLDLEFINPGEAISIQHLDASCDTDQQRLQGLSVDSLDRVHRFLRLWRKLGWKMWEVDLAIRHPALGNGKLDATLVLRLYPLLQLKEQLRALSIEQMCALFGDINADSKFAEAYQKREPSLYERLFLNKRLSNPIDMAFAVDPAPAPTPVLDDHLPPVLAALRISDADLAIFRGLTKPGNGPPYIDGRLTRANLSFLYRHVLLAKALRIKAAEWLRLLFIVQKDVFADPATTLAFVKLFGRAQLAKLSVDQLDYVLTGDRTAKSAVSERTATALLTSLRKSLQTLVAAYDPGSAPSSTDALTVALTAQLQTLGWDAASTGTLLDIFYNRLQLQRPVPSLPGSFTFPAAITAAMAIKFDAVTHTIGFTGFMTDAQRVTLLGVSAAGDYQAAIIAIHEFPRLLLARCRPRFATSLATLPTGVSFPNQLPTDLAARIVYDAERRLLVFFGNMTNEELGLFQTLSPDASYRQAVQTLYNLARTAPSAAEQWLTVGDLLFPLAPDLAKDPDPASAGNVAAAANLSANLKKAEATLLKFLRRVLTEEQIFQQLSAALGITPAILETLVRSYPLFGTVPRSALAGLSDDPFVTSSAAITAVAAKEQYDGYVWLHRVALVLRILKVTFAALDWINRTNAATGVADFNQWPVVFDATTPSVGPIEPLISLIEYMKLHRACSTSDLSMLDVVDRLSDAAYTNSEFAADVENLMEWTASDVAELTAPGTLDVNFPAAYQKVEGWQRLARATAMMRQLNGSAHRLLMLANPVVGADESGTLKHMLRSRNEDEQWLTLSKEVQDVLRARKRDSLIAYLLTTPMPGNSPTGKWEDSNDLFACYLIDVEMCACQPSSRVVQACAAVQMFVQRCLMGLEPNAKVNVLDDGWQQWKWMKYYRVWEANRRVFAFPENYAEPELRRDKSEIFQKLEDELQQREINADNVETAFLHYLDGLNDVAQLEIAGSFYQERTRTLHVVGRSAGTDPRLYYQRQFVDEDRWTAWKRIDCEIKADYVVPLVANERLYLVWPEFRTHPAESQPEAPIPKTSDVSVPMEQPQSLREVFLSITELRNGRWTPKRVTPQAIIETDSRLISEIQFTLAPCDFTWIPDGPFLLVPGTYFLVPPPLELLGCRGYPEPFRGPYLQVSPTYFERDGDWLTSLKNVELSDGDPLVPHGNLMLNQTILGLTPDRFRISYPQYMSYFDKLRVKSIGSVLLDPNPSGDTIPITVGTFSDWFYADKGRTFFVRPELVELGPPPGGEVYDTNAGAPVRRMFYEQVVDGFREQQHLIVAERGAGARRRIPETGRSEYPIELLFSTFYHPLVCAFTKRLYTHGLTALLARETQFDVGGLDFAKTYLPTSIVDPKYPTERVDFDRDGSYSLYNWELFFHAPLMVATRLSKNQRFEEAMQWFHYIFDPTGGHDKDPVTGLPAPAPQKYWITKPFFERQETGPGGYLQGRIENLMNLLASDPASPSANPTIAELQAQVKAWRANPFDPHLVAQFRTVAYQKTTVMKYLDNLIAWGDQRFIMNTMESVNEATQLYVVAAELLGRPPRKVPAAVKPPVETFSELEGKLDAFSNALVEVENLIPVMPPQGEFFGDPPPMPQVLYFCIPQNDKLLGYWTTVADRLYKIRHCLDINGVFSPRALFAPPIDPALLVRAAAAGLDLSAALTDLNAPLPNYRFSTMLQKANEFTNDVRAFGGALLAVLEKKDAEDLALLRQSQELGMLAAVRDVKQKQLEDAQLAIDGLQKNRELVAIRRDFYQSREFMSPGEIGAAGLSAASIGIDAAIAVGYILSGGLKLVPDFIVGAAGFGASPTVHVKTGGQSFGSSAEDAVKTLSAVAATLDKTAALTSTVAGYQRRQDDWRLQARLATKELEQLDKQIASASLKQQISQKELDNHDLQISHSKDIDDFMHSKYTNVELYQWMLGQVSGTYFQSYQLALDLAKRAEHCYRYEIGVDDSEFIQPQYWDSLRNGLMAGERLQLDLRRLESAYLDGNSREFECTKHVSLAMVNPQALLTLKDKGLCVVDLPEELYDLEYAGHYFRRLKSVSISIPCVAGPHTTVNCTLRLLRNMVRISSVTDPQYVHNDDGDGVFTDDERFRESHVRVKAIATSSGQNDSGMFELNFRDERYLPFEGAGAISTWQIELTQERELRQFPYETISDVILHVRYTAREDAGAFRDAAIAHLIDDVLPQAGSRLPLRRLFDLKREFSTEWYAFFHPAAGAGQVLRLKIARQHFPFFAQRRDIDIQRLTLVARTDDRQQLIAQLDPPIGSLAADRITLDALPASEDPSGFHVGKSRDVSGTLLDESQPWELQLTKTPGNFSTLTDAEVAECYMVAEYTLQ